MIAEVSFNYRKEQLAFALTQQQAINYRFIRKSKGWYLHVTTNVKAAPVTTNKYLGAIGVDLNPSHIAFAEINRHGNLVNFGTIATPVQDRRKHQVKATLGNAVTELVQYARKVQKPLAVEDLDFSGKKNHLREHGIPYREL